MTDITVVKRDGRREPLDIDKLHRVLEWACEDLPGVSVSEVELASHIQLYDKIETRVIHETMIKSAADLISEDAPNYQYVASRLVNYQLRKEVYGSYEVPNIYDHWVRVRDLGFYDPEVGDTYAREEWDVLNDYVDHERDFDVVYAGMEQFRGKYLVQNRATKEYYETPNVAMMLIAMTVFQRYPREERLKWVKEFYDALSTFDISLPTPIMAGLRTPQRQFSSCFLIETDDSLDSITATASAIVKYVSQKAGVGIQGGGIRAAGSPIRQGDTYHVGIVPFWRHLSTAVDSCSQGSVRSGKATMNYPCWHLELRDLLVLKNSKGTEETRIRNMDYCVQFNRVMYERLLSGGDITLFSPSDVPGLYDAFFSDDVDAFQELYEKYERSTKVRKERVPAVELFSMFMQERKDTGRVYFMNVDHVNSHGSYRPEVAPIKMTNLCCLHGDTTVAALDENGDYLSPMIRDVVPGYYVLGHDEKTGCNKFFKVLGAQLTKKNTSVVRVTVQNNLDGFSVICTPDHRFYTENRGYVEAQDLTSDDMVMTVLSGGSGPAVVEKIDEQIDVYDIEVEESHNFFANGVLVHNCEVTQNTKPLRFPNDPDGMIALCTLGAVNQGKIKKTSDYERPCTLLVRALNEILDYQDYPVEAGRNHTMRYRPLGVGLINMAHWLVKNDTGYRDPDLGLIHEYMEAWSYYLIKASVDMAEERGACPGSEDTRYGLGIMPIDTYKSDVDGLVEPAYRMDWETLRERAKRYGTYNSTLMAQFPSETSSQVSNAINGVEPPRSLVTVKQSKDGELKQVVPMIARYKNKYELLWDLESPHGYLKIMAVMQKFIDQAISTNTSYNPRHYPDGELTMKTLLNDLLLMYKWGIKTGYYFNTYDGAGEQIQDEEEVCDGCVV